MRRVQFAGCYGIITNVFSSRIFRFSGDDACRDRRCDRRARDHAAISAGCRAFMAAAGGDAAVCRRAGLSADRRASDRAQAFTRHHCIAHRFPADRTEPPFPPISPRSTWPDLPAAAQAMDRLGRSLVGFATVRGNTFELFSDTQAILAAIVRDVDAARTSVLMEFYIWNEGGAADEVLEAVIRAAASRRAVPAADRRARGAAVVEGHAAEAPARRRRSASCGASGRAAAHPGRPHRSSPAPQDRGDRRHGGVDGKHESRRSPLLQAGVRE